MKNIAKFKIYRGLVDAPMVTSHAIVAFNFISSFSLQFHNLKSVVFVEIKVSKIVRHSSLMALKSPLHEY